MSKILKNISSSPISIADTGITIAALSSYTIPPQDYALWAASLNVLTPIDLGTLVVNDGLRDLSIIYGTYFIGHPDDAFGVRFKSDPDRVNGFTSKCVQDAIEEARNTVINYETPVSIGLVNTQGVSVKPPRSDHVHRVDNLTFTSFSPRTLSTTTTTDGNINLTIDSQYEHIVRGSASGFGFTLPNATTLTKGWKYEFYNRSYLPITIKYYDTTTLFLLTADHHAVITLEDNTTSNGIWIVVISNLSDENHSNPDLTEIRDGFEDFMFDAYAGSGGNDNQYSFIPTTNSGSSNIDGAVSAVGNDYEGIHILSTLASDVSRPMVEAFGRANRIKLGAQPEAYEVRVRIEELASIAQKFTCRYGLMDISTAGLPANGVIFSYDPIYPVTPVAQVVTVTPIVTSKAPTQNFIETLNGVDYDYEYKTYKTITVTPNSFPNATYQVISITWARANNRTYTVIINGVTCSYTSDASATDAEISAGLSSAINANVGSAVTATNAKPIVVTSDVLGQEFTYSGTNVTITLTTANVVKAIYTQTINGVNYLFTSDGTPTASEVVAGLLSLINADAGCPATASGTTVLTLTGKTLGADFTYSGTSNLTEADATASTTAAGVVTALKTLINNDVPLPVTATGTATLVLTSDTAGTPFTYAGSANLTQVLTTANVVEVLYSGNWICSVINNSIVTSFNSGYPVTANSWYRLKAVIRADGQGVYFYIDNLYIAEIHIQITLAALRFIFKIEKTVGVSPKTTSIDYLIWRRTR